MASPAFLALLLALLPSFCGKNTFLARAQTQSNIELDFQTEDVQRAPFNASDFLFTFPRAADSTEHGSVKGEAVGNRPALSSLPGLGVAQTLVTLERCSINQPHSHPRGTEFSFVTKGQLLFGFIEENFSNVTKTGGRFISSVITQGNTIVIPQGLIHFALNQGCDQAQFLASFPTKDQGTQTTMRSLFSDQIPNAVLRATTGLTDEDINIVKAKVAENPNPSVDLACLERCNAPPLYNNAPPPVSY